MDCDTDRNMLLLFVNYRVKHLITDDTMSTFVFYAYKPFALELCTYNVSLTIPKRTSVCVCKRLIRSL